jgi:hypothetical protein
MSNDQDILEDPTLSNEEDNTQIQLFDIYPIQIMIQSNIPNKEPFILKSSSFVIDPKEKKTEKKYEELPFFTNEYEYPINYLIKMEFFEIMDFFFVREEFELKMRKYIIKSGKITNTDKEKNSKKNAIYMLQLLFKTVYPSVNNISNSFNEFINNSSSSSDINISALLKQQYTYLQESSKTYTILKVVLLDDIFNNTVYKKLFDAYFEYNTWCIKEKQRIKREYDVNYKKITKIISNYKSFDDDIRLIQQRISNIEEVSKKQLITGNYDELSKLSDLNILKYMFENLKLYKDYIKATDNEKKQKIKKAMNNIFNKTTTTTTTISSSNEEPKDLLYDKILDQLQPVLNSTGIRFDRNTIAFVNSLTQNYNIGKDSKILSDTFLENTTIDISISMEKYAGYTKFINVIKQYLPSIRNTSNIKLQELIDDYANNQFTEAKPKFVIFSNMLYGCFDKYNPVCKLLKDKRKIDIVNTFVETGISEININTNEHKYEIYVHLDLIEGKLNAINTKQISCAYQDSRLANQFSILTNQKKHGSWLLFPAPFMVLPPADTKKTPSESIKKPSRFSNFIGRFTQKNPQSQLTKKMGGRKTKKYNYKNKQR